MKSKSLVACPDGSCVDTQSMMCPQRSNACQREQFLCGDQCKPYNVFVRFKSCDGRCIERNKKCTKTVQNIELENEQFYEFVGILEGAVIILLIIVSIFLIYYWNTNQGQESIVVFFREKIENENNYNVEDETNSNKIID